MRARELGIAIGSGTPGAHNAITDVAGVRVGHTTLVEGEGPLVVGRGPVRTGVTVIVPSDAAPGEEAFFAGSHRLNGNGELTGLEWVRESGLLTTPIGLTNTFSVGVVRDTLAAASVKHGAGAAWALPVVGETYDGFLNDAAGMHVRPEHVDEALAVAASGPVAEGNVGGGTGMICHGFKGGIGTASRVAEASTAVFTVGVLVQANYGRRSRFRVDGRAVGEAIGGAIPLPGPKRDDDGRGSIIVVVATDAPLLPGQCDRLAQRAGLGIARTGGVGEHSSGDLFFAFGTGNRGLTAADARDAAPTLPLSMLSNAYIDRLFDVVVEATEEAILNALLAAETITGRDGNTAHRLEPDVLRDTLARLGA